MDFTELGTTEKFVVTSIVDTVTNSLKGLNSLVTAYEKLESINWNDAIVDPKMKDTLVEHILPTLQKLEKNISESAIVPQIIEILYKSKE